MRWTVIFVNFGQRVKGLSIKGTGSERDVKNRGRKWPKEHAAATKYSREGPTDRARTRAEAVGGERSRGKKEQV